jgi:hypothetical protein
MGDNRNAYRILVERPEGTKRPLGGPRRRWVDNIKIDLWEIGWDGMDWIEVAQDMDHGVGPCEHASEPSGSIYAVNFLNSCTISTFSSRAQLHECVSEYCI